MAQPQVKSDEIALTNKLLRLYIYGSCQSDQYYHPSGQSQSKRPICLSEVEQFSIEDQEADPPQPPQIIPNPLYKQEIYKIACGALHTVVVTVEGAVYTFGCNDQGALGRQGLERIPQLVKLDDAIDLISAGDNHSMFANSIVGSVYFAGSYKYMRGQSMSNKALTPIRFDVAHIDSRLKGVTIQKVVSGSNHSAILIGGRVFVRGEPETNAVGRRINQRHKVSNSMTFDSVGLNHVEDLWCGGYHSFAKVKKGNKWHYFAWGLNKQGQLGLRNYDNSAYPQQIKKLIGKNIIDVAAGTNFTILLTAEGELLGCGQNDDGQLGLGEDYEYVDSEAEEEELDKDLEEKMSLKEEKNQNNPQNNSKQEPKQLVIEKQEQKHEIAEGIKIVSQQVQQNKVQAVAVVKQSQVLISQPKIQIKIPVQQVIEKVQSPIEAIKKLKEQNVYIKNFKPIQIEDKLDHIRAGSQFSFGWNSKQLYSWGFGSNFVLLTGQEDDEYTPFKVKSRIINEHSIYDVAAGAQHVVYLSYPTQQERPEPRLSESAMQRAQAARQKLSRKRKV